MTAAAPQRNLVSAYKEIRQDPCHGQIQLAAADGIRDRMGREGGCVEYAVVDRPIGRLKRERIAHCYGTIRQDASDAEIDSPKMCYNSTRKHSSLGYVSPKAWEAFRPGLLHGVRVFFDHDR